MADLVELLNRLENKAIVLKTALSDTEIELKKCRARNEEQEAKIQLYKQKINDLNNRNQLLKVSNELSRMPNTKKNQAAEKVLVDLIEEIDRCIATLDR